MASTSASYRKMQPTPTRDLSPVPVTSPAPRPVALISPELFEPFTPDELADELACDLEALCEMGIVEAWRDEKNVVRYRAMQSAA